MATFDVVLSWFPDAKRVGDQYMAKCPGHDDNGPSLSIKQGEDGRTLLHCFAGCNAARITQAIGKTFHDLFPVDQAQFKKHKRPTSTSKGPKNTQVYETDEQALEALEKRLGKASATYVYKNAAGETISVQCRFDTPEGGKEFRPISKGPNGWVHAGQPEPRTLYRLPELLAAPPGQTVWVCEGEKAANALIDLGMLATTSPNGAKSARKADWGPVAGRPVVMCRDNDAPGQQYADNVMQLTKESGAESRKILLLPGLEVHGDAYDYVQAARGDGKTDEEIRRDIEALAAAVEPASNDSVIAGYMLTDLGNARRLVTGYGDGLRYTPQYGWLSWDGKRWKIDDTKPAHRCAVMTVEDMLDASKKIAGEDAEKLKDHAKHCQSISRVNAMVEMASFDERIVANIVNFDQQPDLFNCANGTVDLRTGELREHRQDDYFTQCSPVDYDPTATHPVWDAFLQHVTQGDPELLTFLHRTAGYSLTGHTREECFFIVHGPPGSGKSTFIEAMQAVMGNAAQTADFELFLQQPPQGSGPRPELAALRNARMVSSIEVEEGRKLAQALVKTVTGRDRIRCRTLYKESFEYHPQFKLWLVCNHAPLVDDRDDAMWRRIYKVPFDAGLPREKHDQSIKETLTKDPAAWRAILAWAIGGAIKWYTHRLQAPECVRLATEGYRADQDPLKDFFEEECVFGNGYMTKASTIRNLYVAWSEKQGSRVMSRRKFCDRLRGGGLETCHREDGSYWVGIAPRPLDYVPNYEQ